MLANTYVPWTVSLLVAVVPGKSRRVSVQIWMNTHFIDSKYAQPFQQSATENAW